MNKDIFLVIPVYNPPHDLMSKFMDSVTPVFKNIIIINDGSMDIHDEFINSYKKKATIINHEENLGKGAAIKTAYQYILDKTIAKTIVIADCDNQHDVEDILKCAKSSIENPEALVIGYRDFSLSIVPFKSKNGNNITRNVFKSVIGLNLKDTQSGLRAVSPKVGEILLNVEGQRYEFENNVLINCRIKNIPIVEIPIKTIYDNNNVHSHFNPIKDSLRVYNTFKKYLFKVSVPYIINFIIFLLIFNIGRFSNDLYGIMISSLVAGGVGIITKYILNYSTLYKNNYILDNFLSIFKMIIKLFLSAYFIYLIYTILEFNLVFTKIFVDLVISILVFIVFKNIGGFNE